MSEPLLSINSLSVRHLNKTLFTDLNFTITPGEHWAVVGESGSGKSALLQTIAGRFNITSGSITYNFAEQLRPERDIQEFNPHKLISLVEPKHHFRNLSNTTDFYYQQRFNSSDSEDALTVEQYLLSMPIVPRPHLYWSYEKVITLFKLHELRSKQLIKLSNGETKRLMLAAALLRNPVLLLLDMPLSGLDTHSRVEFNPIIQEIVNSGTTVIMATSPYEIPDIITHIAILGQGTIKESIPKTMFEPQSFPVESKQGISSEILKTLLDHGKGESLYKLIVKMNNVHIAYSGKVILEEVNWQIMPGERWALLGPNGAGKSTLLSLINGDNPQAYANDIILFDKQRGTGESIWDIKSKTGFVSPELHQYFPTDNNCLQVIESGYYDTLGLFRPSNEIKAAKALRWMEALEIEKYAHGPVKNMPASAQRLCLLARALIKNPSLLIFDEPCQGFDQHQLQHFKKLIDTICMLSNVTLIYVTHYEQEIPDSVTRVLKLDGGRVIKTGSR